MFCWLKLGPQDSSSISTRCHFTERREGGVFLLRFVFELIKVNNCCYGHCYEKVTYCRLDFLNFTAFMLEIE